MTTSTTTHTDPTTMNSNTPTGSYTVHVKFIDCDHFPRWVALDENGDWRANGCHIDMYDLSGRELVEYLYHSDEVLRAWVDEDGVTWAEIAEWGPVKGDS